ncbi:MAG: glycoside hydrolase family 25 protein [Alphaproteobacteria bacterium]|nr:glycoside hydrolase family 25 protein [Alphaproteobacteria bacterium]
MAAIALGVAAIGAAALGIGYTHYLDFEPASERFPVQGIDISHHQGAIDWDALKRREVRFVYLKASEGGDHVDTRFAENWRAARRAGIARGAYHFFTLCKPGIAQAHNFMRTVPVEAQAMPPAVDLEFGGNCKRRPTKAVLLRELAAFLVAIERHYGKKPILYVTRGFHDRYLTGALGDYGFWIRSIYFRPDLPDRTWLFWQFHNRGSRDGITGAVDLNVFNGDWTAFERWRKTGQWQPDTGPAPADAG